MMKMNRQWSGMPISGAKDIQAFRTFDGIWDLPMWSVCSQNPIFLAENIDPWPEALFYRRKNSESVSLLCLQKAIKCNICDSSVSWWAASGGESDRIHLLWRLSLREHQALPWRAQFSVLAWICTYAWQPNWRAMLSASLIVTFFTVVKHCWWYFHALSANNLCVSTFVTSDWNEQSPEAQDKSFTDCQKIQFRPAKKINQFKSNTSARVTARAQSKWYIAGQSSRKTCCQTRMAQGKSHNLQHAAKPRIFPHRSRLMP
jgi:hypothetical protein